MSKYKENVNLATLQTFGKKLGKWRIWQGSRNAVINQLQVILEKIRQHCKNLVINQDNGQFGKFAEMYSLIIYE